MTSGGGGGGGEGLSNLAIVLIIIFAILLVGLLAQFLYVLWRRRVFRGRTNAARDGGGDEVSISQYSSSESNFSSAAHSKELLYFFCLRPHYRPELDSPSPTTDAVANGLNQDQESDFEAIDIDLLKIQGIFGPPRFLFTIKEEEKEGAESAASKPLRPAEKEAKRELSGKNESRTRPDDRATAAEVAHATEDRGVDYTTPFSTPCGSPAYFTPENSPVHESIGSRSGPVEVTLAPGSA